MSPAAVTSEFESRVEPYRRELLAHCYRMLGSIADAEDALQEALLRAWKGIGDFEGRSSLRTWLYRICSHVCLDFAERRGARVSPETHKAASLPDVLESATPELPWLEPAPSAYWRELPASPEATVDAKQSVGLAFLALIQRLPPLQRAVLLLREVMGWSAMETAELLETSVPSVNSALQRARASLESHRDRNPLSWPDEEGSQTLLLRYIEAWEKGAPDLIAEIVREDVVVTMPPIPSWYQGAASATAFFRRLFQRVPPDRVVLMTEAAGGPAAALYVRAPGEKVYRASSIHVLEWDGKKITGIHAFMNPEQFSRFGLPAQIEKP